jgi:thioredoxin-like negative regulator of GroEL
MRILPALAALAIALTAPAHAGTLASFNASTFQALRAHHRPVVLFVHAPWCPICRAQEKTITSLLAMPRYKDVTVLTIDFDTQKALWSRFGVRQQSTLIGFRGSKETGRLSFDADPAKVTAVLASTLG